MAQDLFFIPLSTESPQQFERRLVLDILGKDVAEPITSYVCRYVDGSWGEASDMSDASRVHLDHLGFTRFGGRMMMERIYDLADALEVFLTWSDVDVDGPGACVTRPERLELVQPEVRHLSFAVARDASHLNLLVKGTRFEDNGWA